MESKQDRWDSSDDVSFRKLNSCASSSRLLGIDDIGWRELLGGSAASRIADMKSTDIQIRECGSRRRNI